MGHNSWNLFHIVLLLLLFFVSCSLEAKVVTFDVHAAKELLQSGHLYLDVRTEEEFKKGHVEKALNIPYMIDTPEGRVKSKQFMEQVHSTLCKEDHLVVGCRSGVRSLDATIDLLEAGFKNVCNLGGGYIDWVEQGFVVKRPKDEL
ncbi:transferase [Lithospermum erythrorhizon]|uniref:Transferase n=1 Tax=Lithospermum erythrorhizon TaxID=34254 RepID=A0AAV3PLA7_LITER